MHLRPHRPASTLPLLLIILPAVFLLVGLLFTLLAITTPDWTHRQIFRTPTNFPSSFGTYLGTIHRSPFVYCILEPHHTQIPPNTPGTGGGGGPPWVGGEVRTETDWWEVCQRSWSVSSGVVCGKREDEVFCQRMRITGGLLLGGTVLVGIASICCLVLIGSSIVGVYKTGYILIRTSEPLTTTSNATASAPVTVTASGVTADDASSNANEKLVAQESIKNIKRESIQRQSAYLALMMVGVGIAGAVTVGMAHMLGLVGGPQERVAPLGAGMWLVGKGVGFAAAGWTSALVGTGLGLLVWDVPKVGIRAREREGV